MPVGGMSGGFSASNSSSASSSLEGGDTSAGGNVFDFSRGKRDGGLDTNTAIVLGLVGLAAVVVLVLGTGGKRRKR